MHLFFMTHYFISFFLFQKKIGPLMTKREDGRWSLIGVVSSGYSCAKPKQVHSLFIHFHSNFIYFSFTFHSFFFLIFNHVSFIFHLPYFLK